MNTKSTTKKHGPFYRLSAKWFRWVHIYLSLISLAAILFFSVTGLTLNHPDWFFSESIQNETGQMSPAWLTLKNPPPADWDGNDFSHEIDRLKVAEYLRSQHRLRGLVSDFLSFSDECSISFQGPGYAANATVQRGNGEYTVQIATNDLVSVLNDFHKGRNTGPIWTIVIDISAIISTVVALSGFALIFFLKFNRIARISCAIAGALLMFVLMLATR